MGEEEGGESEGRMVYAKQHKEGKKEQLTIVTKKKEKRRDRKKGERESM